MKKVITLIILTYSLCNPLYGNRNIIQHNLLPNKHIEIIFNNNFFSKKMFKDRNKKIALLYLEKYESKDLKGIGDIFSNDIVLRDWKIRVEGKEKALLETKKNFESVDSIKIEVLSLYENDNSVAAELKIIINNSEELYVVDVITINPEGKINSIKAFIGRGN